MTPEPAVGSSGSSVHRTVVLSRRARSGRGRTDPAPATTPATLRSRALHHTFSSRPFWAGAAILFGFSVLYGWIQSRAVFLDPDSFYHARMADLMAEHGLVRTFPWLPFTTLADAFADHHCLYHILLVPFVRVLGPLSGARDASVLFAAAAITMFYALLEVFKVRGAVFFAALLGCTGGFILRLNLAKASSLSLCVVLAAVILIEKRRPYRLFALSWLYVWLYGGWPLLILVGGVFAGAPFLAERFWPAASRPGAPRSETSKSSETLRSELQCALAIPLGLLGGLVIHPYFPQSLRFYWEQIVQIAVVGYGGRIEVGSEWYPYPPLRLLVELGPVCLAFFLAILVLLPMALTGGKDRGPLLDRADLRRFVPSVLMAIVFLVMTLRSRRYVEYFAPFAMLVTGIVTSALLKRIPLRETWARMRAGFGVLSFVPVLLGVYLGLLGIFFAARDVLAVRAAYDEGIPWSRFSRACAWLTEHTPERSVVFHGDFNDFPILFFHDARNRYVNGLDPTFLYRKNPEKYRLWAEITAGQFPEGGGAARDDRSGHEGRESREGGQSREGRGAGIAKIIQKEFDSRTVLIGKDHASMKSLLAKDPDARLVYEDDDAWIYEVM